MPKKKRAATLDQEASDGLACDPPIRVNRSKPAAVSIPGERAARAAFLAKLHRETGVDQWVERVVRERVALEEFAVAQAKRRLAS